MARARARRYAKAVFELAQEEGDVAGWANRLEEIRSVLTDPSARQALFNPVIPTARRVEVMGDLVTGAMGREGGNLARMLVAAGDPELIEGVVEEFTRLADEAAGRVRATATTAVDLTPEDRDRITAELSRRLGREVRLDVRVDPSIIGGMVLQFGDRLIDASVATRLQQLRRRLAAT